MTYATEQQAHEAAMMFNKRQGYDRAEVVLVEEGWAIKVDCSFGVARIWGL